MNDKPKNQPVHTIRIGCVNMAFWKNIGGSHGHWYTVTIERLYKNDDGKGWKSTRTFRSQDLLALAKLADLAHTWMMEKEKEEKENE